MSRLPQRVTIPLFLLLAPTVDGAQEAAMPYGAAFVAFYEETSIVRTADLNGDGFADAIGWHWINNDYNDVRVRVFTGNGDGTFHLRSTITRPIDAQYAPWVLEVGRFNADDRDDFALSLTEGASTVRVYTSSVTGSPSLRASWIETVDVRSIDLPPKPVPESM